MSIDPSLWGPSFWGTLHWSAAAYPKDPTALDKLSARRLVSGMGGMLPCPTCRVHFQELMAKHSIETSLGNGALFRSYVTMLHNNVNERTGSSERWTDEQVFKQYPIATHDGTKTLVPTVQAGRPNMSIQIRAAAYDKRPVARAIPKPVINYSLGHVNPRALPQARASRLRGVTVAVVRSIAGVAAPKKKGCGCRK